MKNKLILTLSLFILASCVHGQSVQLANLTADRMDSREVYVGRENIFLVKSSAKILSVQASDGTAILDSNRLIVKPHFPGNMQLVFKTKKGAQKLTLLSEYYPIEKLRAKKKSTH